jgi:putative heme utilization carrier protein HutX
MTSQTSSAARDDLRQQLAEKPDGVLEALAAQHGLPLQTVVECLPEAMWTRVSGGHFVGVMEEITTWGPVTVIAHTKDVILEFEGTLPPGRLGHGFYNLQGGHGGLHGHLRADNCKAIVFLRRPFMGKDTASVQFFNADGEAMFKIFVGRDDKGALREDQIARLTALQDRLSTPAAA